MEMEQYHQQQYQQQQQPQAGGEGKPYLQSQPVNGGAGGDGTADAEGADGGEGGAAGKYQDLWAAILFLAHVGFIAYLAFSPGLKALRDQKLTTEDPGAEPGKGEEGGMEKNLTTIYMGLIVVLAAAAGWSAVWTGILLRNASRIITAALFGAVASSLVGAVLAVVYGNIMLAVVCVVMAAIQGMWYYCVRNRIPFGT